MVTDSEDFFCSTSICVHHSAGIATQLDCGLFSGSIHEAELEIHGELESHGGICCHVDLTELISEGFPAAPPSVSPTVEA